jgi:hypothetical protein
MALDLPSTVTEGAFFDLLITFILFAGITWLISIINNLVSRLAIYHDPKSEPFLKKVFLVFMIYILLSIPVLFSIWVSITFIFSTKDLTATEIISLNNAKLMFIPIATLTFLFLMRMLMNPTYNNFDFLLRIGSNEGANLNKIRETTIIFKERVNSFFSSFICITLVIFLFFMIVSLWGSPDATSFQSNIGNIIPTLDEGSSITLAESYLVSLVILTLFIEIALYVGNPVFKNEWLIKIEQKQLTIEVFETFEMKKTDKLFYYANHYRVFLSKLPSKFIPSIKNKIEEIKKANSLIKRRHSSHYSYYYAEERTEDK